MTSYSVNLDRKFFTSQGRDGVTHFETSLNLPQSWVHIYEQTECIIIDVGFVEFITKTNYVNTL